MITRGEKSQEKKQIPFEKPEMGGFSEPCKLNGFRKTLINHEKFTDMASLYGNGHTDNVLVITMLIVWETAFFDLFYIFFNSTNSYFLHICISLDEFWFEITRS